VTTGPLFAGIAELLPTLVAPIKRRLLSASTQRGGAQPDWCTGAFNF